jgi:hypothetical protein
MGMKRTLDVINAMEADGIIRRYAIAGAVATYNYIDPAATDDLDLLVAFGSLFDRPQSGLVVLSPIFTYLKAKGYDEHRAEGLVIEGWPVQFLPVASDLDAEALAQADEIEITVPNTNGAVRTRILRPEHIVATALRVGRSWRSALLILNGLVRSSFAMA